MDEFENIVPLGELGMRDEDLIDVQIRKCPEGGADFFYEFTERGDAILQAAAKRAGITPDEYLKKLTLRPQEFPLIH